MIIIIHNIIMLCSRMVTINHCEGRAWTGMTRKRSTAPQIVFDPSKNLSRHDAA
jgi:hypothetical protein